MVKVGTLLLTRKGGLHSLRQHESHYNQRVFQSLPNHSRKEKKYIIFCWTYTVFGEKDGQMISSLTSVKEKPTLLFKARKGFYIFSF